MSKWIRSLALMTALAALSAGTVSVAQEKGGKAVQKKEEKKPKADKVGTVEYYKNEKNGKWRFIIRDENDKTIALPLANTSYESKDDAIKAIEKLKKILTDVKPTEGDVRK